MKKLLYLFLTLFYTLIQAQEKPIIISGKIFAENVVLDDVHVINETSSIGTLTDNKGNFEILVQKGDLLLFSHLNFETQQYLISDEDIFNKKLLINLINKTYVLDEIIVKNTKGIFDIDKDIMPHNLPEVNAKTLSLPYAEDTAIKEKKILKIKSLGATVNLDEVFNVLSGQHKKQKELKEAQLSDENLLAIRNHFTDSFFTNQLKIKKEQINVFLNDAKYSGIIRLYQKNKVFELTSILIESSKSFSHTNYENETTLGLK